MHRQPLDGCGKKVDVNPERATGTPRTDRLSATRLSLAIFKNDRSALMVREKLAGHFSSVTEANEWMFRGNGVMRYVMLPKLKLLLILLMLCPLPEANNFFIYHVIL